MTQEEAPKPKRMRPAAVRKPAAVPAPRAPKTEQEWQDDLDSLLKRAAAAGVRPERLLARSSVKRGVSVFERAADFVLDAIEGKKK